MIGLEDNTKQARTQDFSWRGGGGVGVRTSGTGTK